jgi:hypothetical protein
MLAVDFIRKCQPIRWGLATLILLGWLGLIGYWLFSDSQPACQVTTVTQSVPAKVTTTRSCDLPSISDYAYLLAPAVLLILPDAKSIKLGGFGYESLTDEIAGAVSVAGQAAGGDTPEDSEPAEDVLGRLLADSDESDEVDG